MAVGYVLGSLFNGSPEFRRSFLLGAGAALFAGFLVLRGSNIYGDPVGWTPQSTWLGTTLSFIDCEKYPPSLLFLMMTLGPALILLGLFDRADGTLVRWLTTFGRVPFLFYVVHLQVIHALAVELAWFTVGDVGWMFGSFVSNKPAGYGLSLGRHLCRVARGFARTLPALRLVRRPQAAPTRLVVELSLSMALSNGLQLLAQFLSVMVCQLSTRNGHASSADECLLYGDERRSRPAPPTTCGILADPPCT